MDTSDYLNAQTFIYKTVGDVKIDLDVYTPPCAAPKSGYPLFFAIHGGGYIHGDKQAAFTVQELNEVMKRGWAIVSINYRLIPAVFLEDILQDVQDAYQWVRTELVKTISLNLNLVTVFGQSAGGGLAALSGYKLTPRPQAVISFYPFCSNWADPYSYRPEGPVDLAIVAAANKLSVPAYTEYLLTKADDPRDVLWRNALASGKMGWLMTTHDPNFSTEDILAKLKELSTTENIDKNYPPTYLAHGLADTIVPYSQSVQLAKKLEENNIPHVLDLVPDEGHVFDADPILWHEHVLPAFNFAQKYMETPTITETES